MLIAFYECRFPLSLTPRFHAGSKLRRPTLFSYVHAGVFCIKKTIVITSNAPQSTEMAKKMESRKSNEENTQ